MIFESGILYTLTTQVWAGTYKSTSNDYYARSAASTFAIATSSVVEIAFTPQPIHPYSTAVRLSILQIEQLLC